MLRNKRKEKKSKKQRWNLPASQPMRYAYFRVPEASARPGMRSSAMEGSASGSVGRSSASDWEEEEENGDRLLLLLS